MSYELWVTSWLVLRTYSIETNGEPMRNGNKLLEKNRTVIEIYGDKEKNE